MTAKRLINTLTALAFITVNVVPPFTATPAQAVTTTKVAPNVMIILGNSHSMARPITDVGDADYAEEYAWPDNRNHTTGVNAGAEPNSKFYAAKTALQNVLSNDTLTAGVNLGFAQYRQIFGMSLTEHNSRSNAYISNPVIAANIPKNIPTDTDGEKAALVGRNDNYDLLTGGLPRGAKIVKNSKGKGGLPLVFSWERSVNGSPKEIIYTLCKLEYRSEGNEFLAGYQGSYVIETGHAAHRVDPDGYAYSLYPTSIPGKSELAYRTGVINDDWSVPSDASGGQCRNNILAKLRSLGQDYPPYRAVDQLFLHDKWGSRSGPDGKQGTRSYWSVIPWYKWSYRNPPRPAGSDLNAALGSLTGWSGETTYTPPDGGAEEKMTSEYPAKPANPKDRGLREPILRMRATTDYAGEYGGFGAASPYIKTNIEHMGVFLNLPKPELGYVDQRPILRQFARVKVMDNSGEDYDPAAQAAAVTLAEAAAQSGDPSNWSVPANAPIIKRNAGVTTSGSSYDNQSPAYMALYGAYAYYSQYIAKDPHKDCRNNFVLLIYDGRENGRWTVENGVEVFADPKEMAAKLAGIGVKVFVIAATTSLTQRAAADAVAYAGGTNKAFTVASQAEMDEALNATFARLLQGETSRSAPAMSTRVTEGDLAFIAGRHLTEGRGYLRAYRIDQDGNINTGNRQWDAAQNMDVAVRKQTLLSTDASGKIIDFNDLDNAAFGALPSGLTPAIIKSYTFDPSYDGGKYLAGRAAGSLMGIVGETDPLVFNPVGDPHPALLRDTSYRTYVKDVIEKRPKLVLVAANDGFIYAFNQTDGELVWGWMPRDFVQNLQKSTFWKEDRFSGQLRIVDAKNNGSWGTYLIGVADSGKLHFSLKLNAQGKPEKSVFSHNSGVAVTRLSRPAITRMGEHTYWHYIYTPNALRMSNVASSGVPHTISTTFTLSSEPHVTSDTVYVGASNGDIYSMPLKHGTTPNTAGNFTLVGNFGAAAPILYVGSTTGPDAEYLRAQSTTRLSVFKRPTNGRWTLIWSVYNGGVSEHNPDASALPVDAVITDEALFEGGQVLLPLTATPPPVGNAVIKTSCNVGNGLLYIHALDTGTLSGKKFINSGVGAPRTAKTGLFQKRGGGALKMNHWIKQEQGTDGNGDAVNPPIPGGNDSLGRASWRELRMGGPSPAGGVAPPGGGGN